MATKAPSNLPGYTHGHNLVGTKERILADVQSIIKIQNRNNRKLKQIVGVEEALEDDHNLHDGKESTGFGPHPPGGKIIGAIAELARCQIKYDAEEAEYDAAMELVVAARNEYDQMRDEIKAARNLLAIIHRDGGHHFEKHGLESYALAEKIANSAHVLDLVKKGSD